MIAHYRLSLTSTLTSTLAALVVAIAAPPATAAPLATDSKAADVLSAGDAPNNLAELQEMQSRIQSLATRLIPTTVAIQVGQAHGSGVIISPDGYILTAAHVAGAPNLEATVRLHDGRMVAARTLGVFRTVDAGLIRITTEPEAEGWPAAKMGNSLELRPGDWCLATGHPGGFQNGRQPILRVGRILDKEVDAIQTDCYLIGGDSGGPLFDTLGQVVGIHSRIGKNISVNLHVPVNEFKVSWDRLAASEAWGELPGSDRLTDPHGEGRRDPLRAAPHIGVQGELDAANARVSKVFADSPAERAGILPGDIIVQFDRQPVAEFDSLVELVQQCKVGQPVKLVILRGGKRLVVLVEIGQRKVQR